ncbi:hypothetical protein BGZ72_006738 [Mortierella alpina]|nr:hypothetical protein BGZ72_006738 [Mortierella alpina]
MATSVSTSHSTDDSVLNSTVKTPPTNKMTINTAKHLSVPAVINDSTTLLQTTPTSDEDNFKAILSPVSTSAAGLDILTSAQVGQAQASPDKQPKHALSIITAVAYESITKSAPLGGDAEDYAADDAEDGAEDDEDAAETSRELEIADKLFHLQHGYTKAECCLPAESTGLEPALNAVQVLALIQHPHTVNFGILVEQLRSMRTAAVAMQLKDVVPLELSLQKCERVLARHQAIDHLLETLPTQDVVIKALHGLLRACCKETTELLEDWTTVYYTLQDIVHHVQRALAAQTTGASAASTFKPRLSLFTKRSAHPTFPQLSPEVAQYQGQVCANWSAQIKAIEQLARSYRDFAEQVTEFSLIDDIVPVSKYHGDYINKTFMSAQEELLNTEKLCQLHALIDYSNLHKTLPKGNALSTAEDRKPHPPGPLFSRQLIGERHLVREGRLTEFISPFTPTTGSSKKKNASAAPSPKAYRLIVASDMVYLCEEVAVAESTGDLDSKRSKKANKSSSKMPLRLVHEPVLVIDCQISSTPDILQPPYFQKNLVMLSFYNETNYILQAETGEERDAWVDCARRLDIEQPKPTEACREQDESDEIRPSTSTSSIGAFAKSKASKKTLVRILKSLRRSTNNLTEDAAIPEIHPDQITKTEEEEYARRMQLGQPSLWEVRRLPLDLGVIPPLEHPIPFRKSHLYDVNVKIVDLTTGKMAPGEFGMGIEDRAAYFRDECALFAVLRPARLIPSHELDRKRDDFFLCGKRRVKGGEVMFVEPPYITDFYARSWLHPGMHIEFDVDSQSVMIAKMYRIICSSPEIVVEFQKYHAWLMENAKISPDNTFLCMDYRSPPLRISKQIEKVASSTATSASASAVADSRALEAGRKYTEMGECNIEFRRMSNAPDALSVGFYNPATKRDMATGVMVFDKEKVKATASGLGLNALAALGTSNGVVRVSATELSLTLWQTDARTRPTFVKGQRVFETVKSKSLDVFKLVGQRESLDELEEFIRVKMGTECKARDIRETYKLIRVAFQDDILDAPEEEDEEEEGEGAEERETEQDVDGFTGSTVYNHRADGFLATVPEENEDEVEQDSGSKAVEQKDKALDTKTEDLRASTSTFRCKTRSTLALMEKQQQLAEQQLQQQLQQQQRLEEQQQREQQKQQKRKQKQKQRQLEQSLQQQEERVGSGILQFDSSMFSDLSSESDLSVFMDGSVSQLMCSRRSSSRSHLTEDEPVQHSVRDLAKFWTDPTSPAAAVQFSCSDASPVREVEEEEEKEEQKVVEKERRGIALANELTGEGSRVSEFTAKSQALRSRSTMALQTLETNDNDIVRATRYLPKHKIRTSDGFLIGGDKNGDVEPGVDMEHHMPVKDLRKRWEEIHRLGV